MSLDPSFSFFLKRTRTVMFALLPSVEDIKGILDNDLKTMVNDLELEMRHFRMENEIFYAFLENQEPTMVIDMNEILEKAEEVRYKSHLSLQTLRTFFGSDETQISQRFSELITKGPRINASLKTDLILRKFEEINTSTRQFVKASKKMKAHLRAENEELQIQLSDIRMSLETFERVIVKGAVSKVTQKIPAEKFVRYMQDWLKSAQYLLEKLRLRSLAFKTQLKKLKSSILHKQDLCRHVDIADFNVMQIEKEHLIEKLKQKNQNLIELKQMTTKGNSLLLVNKEILKKQCEALNMIKEMTDSAKKKVQVLMQEAAVTEQEVKRLRVKYKRLRTLANSYNTPSTIEYIKKKAELRELLKELKAIRRRDRLADISLVTYTKMMCKITGASEPEDSWYRLKTDASILEQLSNTDLPHLESCDSIISELDI